MGLPYAPRPPLRAGLAVVPPPSPLPAMGAATQRAAKQERRGHSLWKHRNLVFGIPAIFIYLIAEIGVGNLFINFVSQPNIGNLSHQQASNYLFLLWGGMMIGRLVGAAAMQKIDARNALAIASIGAAAGRPIASGATVHVATLWLLSSVTHLVPYP